MFERSRRMAKTSDCKFQISENISEHALRSIDDLVPRVLFNAVLQPTVQFALLCRANNFVPGSVGSAAPFWQNEILRDCPPSQRDSLFEWLNGVSGHDFFDEHVRGEFQGGTFSGADFTPKDFPNHVPIEHEACVDNKVANLVTKGCLARWSDVANVSNEARPRIVLPPGVKPKKLYLFWDRRYVNLMCKHTPLKMGGVGNVAQCAWPGAHRVTLDHKSGYDHAPLAAESWQYFGPALASDILRVDGPIVWLVIVPYLYHTLSVAVVQYLRARDIPVLVWINDFYLCNFRSTRSLTQRVN